MKTVALLLLSIAVASPSVGERCCCAQGPSEPMEQAPSCCAKRAAEARCAADADAASCCKGAPDSCDCEGCGGPRRAEPLTGPAPGPSVVEDVVTLPAILLRPFAADDSVRRLAACSAEIEAAPPPDRRALLCVWTL